MGQHKYRIHANNNNSFVRNWNWNWISAIRYWRLSLVYNWKMKKKKKLQNTPIYLPWWLYLIRVTIEFLKIRKNTLWIPCSNEFTQFGSMPGKSQLWHFNICVVVWLLSAVWFSFNLQIKVKRSLRFTTLLWAVRTRRNVPRRTIETIIIHAVFHFIHSIIPEKKYHYKCSIIGK